MQGTFKANTKFEGLDPSKINKSLYHSGLQRAQMKFYEAMVEKNTNISSVRKLGMKFTEIDDLTDIPT